MTPDAPSPLLHALRWSLPGAALLSIPVGAVLQSYLQRGGFPSLLGMPAVRYGLAGATGLLALVTAITSSKAIIHCTKTVERPLLIVLIIIFNVLALLASSLIFLGIGTFIFLISASSR